MSGGTERETALRAISLLDLTNLDEDCRPADIDALCKRARTPHGDTAAVCIWPRFVAQARQLLAGSGIRIATVVNFPAGGTDTAAVVAQTRQALADGADEIDLVFPHGAFLEGDRETARDQIAAVRAACPPPALLKVIIETGVLAQDDIIRAAAGLAIAAGADFIKTSTGKVKVNATPEAARLMLGAIRQSGKQVGFKPAGGIRTTRDCELYLRIADEMMGEGWATPATFRFGASGVLVDLLATIDGKEGAAAGAGY